MQGNIDGDRRSQPRVIVTQPCKVYDPRGQRYLAGHTRDISADGMLIEVPRILGVKPGDCLHVAVACKRRQGLIRAAEMSPAIVMRSLYTVDDHTLVGVRLQQPLVAAAAVETRLAA